MYVPAIADVREQRLKDVHAKSGRPQEGVPTAGSVEQEAGVPEEDSVSDVDGEVAQDGDHAEH